MAIDEAIIEGAVAGAVGGVLGIVAAVVTARSQIKTKIKDVEGRLKAIELTHRHRRERDDRVAQANAERTAIERVAALRLAATGLVRALRDPDAFRRNVSKAKGEVDVATAAIRDSDRVVEVARKLQAASQNDDVEQAESVLSELNALDR